VLADVGRAHTQTVARAASGTILAPIGADACVARLALALTRGALRPWTASLPFAKGGADFGKRRAISVAAP
jgi:hypothetical protein